MLHAAEEVRAALDRMADARVYVLPVELYPPASHGFYQVILRPSAREARRYLIDGELLGDLAGEDVRLATAASRLPIVALSKNLWPMTRLMGILNVTPDSFSDGGRYVDRKAAVDHARRMMEEGAAIIDIGGESTRPGALPVDPAEEIARVVPVIEALRTEAAERGVTLSIDTRRAATMRAALDAGAGMINDVTALGGDAESLAVAAGSSAEIVLMHMQGEPQTMQQHPHYEIAALDVYDALEERIAACEAAGIARSRLIVDPGIGFGKSLQHNLEILRHFALYLALGTPTLLGVSRKSFIAALSQKEEPSDRLPGSLAAAIFGAASGVSILRVHDVAETRQALAVWSGIADD